MNWATESLLANSPSLSFPSFLQRFFSSVSDQVPFIHPHAINESSSIGPGTQVWAFAHVMKGAVIGRNVNVGDHAFGESGAKVGDNVTIKNAVLIWDGVTIESDCFIGPRATFTNDKLPRSPRMDSAPERYQQRETWIAETLVQAGSSIGAAATIGTGVTLGRGCMVGRGTLLCGRLRTTQWL